jgi:hypothetical protein
MAKEAGDTRRWLRFPGESLRAVIAREAAWDGFLVDHSPEDIPRRRFSRS